LWLVVLVTVFSTLAVVAIIILVFFVCKEFVFKKKDAFTRLDEQHQPNADVPDSMEGTTEAELVGLVSA